MQKKTLVIIILLMSFLLLSPFIFFYGLYVVKLIVFPFSVLFYFFEYVYLSFFISIIFFIATLLFLKNINAISKILLAIMLSFSVAVIGGLYEAEIYIKNKSLEKFGKEPIYLNICLKSALQFCPFRCDDICYYPHALVEKNGKYYYWSFQKKDFFILPDSILPYWQIKKHNKSLERNI